MDDRLTASEAKPDGVHVHQAAPRTSVASPASRGEAAGAGHRAPTQPEPLLPCPECGLEDAMVTSLWRSRAKKKFAVNCLACSAEGPRAASLEEAIEEWNRAAAASIAASERIAFDPWLEDYMLDAEFDDEHQAAACDIAWAAWHERAKQTLQPLQSQGREVPTGRDEWQAIETAPKDERVLLFVPAFGAWIASWWPGSWSWAREQWAIHSPFAHGDKAIFGIDAPQPTHWMAMPAPPNPHGGPTVNPLADARFQRPDDPDTSELLRQAAEALEDAKELLLDYSPRSRTAKKCDLVAAALRQRAGSQE